MWPLPQTDSQVEALVLSVWEKKSVFDVALVMGVN